MKPEGKSREKIFRLYSTNTCKTDDCRVKYLYGGDFMQTVIYGMLQEEKRRNLEMQEAHRQEIQALRKGSVTVKRIGGHNYYYLKYRQGKSVRNDYIGKDKNIADEIKRETEKRKYLDGVLKRLQQEYHEISKIVKD
jgi:hypothetical protein